MKKFLTLLKIEGILSLRCIDSIFFGVFMPVGIMILIALIAGQNPASTDAGYSMIQSSFGALVTVGICATAFMGIPLTIADYRDKKILKHFFVTPVSPTMLLWVHAVINMLLSIISALLIYMVATLFFGYEIIGSTLLFIGSFLLVMVSMYSLGLLIASLCRTVKTANVVCSIVYFPMLFLSGATIPFELFPKPLQTVASFLPLTQGIKLLKSISLGLETNLLLPLIILFGSLTIGVILSMRFFRWE
ncbi:ABC transporter permease [Acetobacterium woodii]|uniref:Transport permease protein n=1 Tax=Acetobacterium woodii (strain ATCC 29683 / DSM 1030 / JCM 2381 / KCTC 1655 / WB1) TaxID=931626 RepID=H6LCV7_ACEWD|nr:ABC transporter permease [Acetobacterium woodii]AFA49094.1 putative ABC transport system permease protein [Acetobacterium woodii DSM 1030]